MDWYKLLEIIKWPAVVVFVLRYFQGEIRGLINRTNSGKLPGGIEFNAPTNQNPPNENIPAEIKDAAEDKKEEVQNNPDQSLPQLQNTVNELQLQLATFQIALLFERTYKDIYGSQIKLLEALRSVGPQGLLYEDISARYQQVRVTWPILNSYPLSNYLGFLEGAGLIEQLTVENQMRYKITPLGINFLEYIESLFYLKEKPY